MTHWFSCSHTIMFSGPNHPPFLVALDEVHINLKENPMVGVTHKQQPLLMLSLVQKFCHITPQEARSFLQSQPEATSDLGAPGA